MATEEIKVIFSSDKDLLQLINETTSVYSPLQRYTYRMGDKVKFGDYYIPHQNILTVKILMGDKSDNIQGIERLGEKTFVKFFPEVLETTLNVDDILTRTKRLIEENNKITEEKQQALDVCNHARTLLSTPVTPHPSSRTTLPTLSPHSHTTHLPN